MDSNTVTKQIDDILDKRQKYMLEMIPRMIYKLMNINPEHYQTNSYSEYQQSMSKV